MGNLNERIEHYMNEYRQHRRNHAHMDFDICDYVAWCLEWDKATAKLKGGNNDN